ncbi:MAG: hypothetical protein AAF436_10665 [Myxococcota bacterium]
MTINRRDFVVGSGALLSTAAFTQACGRASSDPRPMGASDVADPPIVGALRYGVTAPSAHNTQPWLIELVSETEARLFVDPERLLPATDPPARQIHISHGTFVEAVAIAATQHRYLAEVTFLPEGPMAPSEFGAKPTAAIRLIEAPSTKRDTLFDQLLLRRTSRLPHEGPMVTREEAAPIVAEASDGGLDVKLLPEAELPEAFEIIRTAMAIEVNDFTTYDETRAWFRFSKRATRRHGDGLSINTAGLTGFAAGSANVFLGERNFHKEKNRARFLKTFDETVDSSRGVLTITSSSNTMTDWLASGRAYLRAQLAASARGLRLHPVSQALQEYSLMDEPRAQVHQLLGVEAPARIQMLVRIGRTRTPGLSPRRPLSEMMTQRS